MLYCTIFFFFPFVILSIKRDEHDSVYLCKFDAVTETQCKILWARLKFGVLCLIRVLLFVWSFVFITFTILSAFHYVSIFILLSIARCMVKISSEMDLSCSYNSVSCMGISVHVSACMFVYDVCDFTIPCG